ncbi:MAG: nickel-dependent lactate racemase [Peptostreptococcaceae bacterium]
MGMYSFKYGKEKLSVEIEDSSVIHTLLPKDTEIINDIKSQVIKVLDNPVGTKPLKEIISTGERVAIVVSDITRLWIKTNEFLIHIVNYLSKLGIEDNDMFVVIALGGHRKCTENEMISIVGKEVYKRLNVYNHECEDMDELVYMGESSRKTPIYLNKRVHEANRVILTGGIVFHLFAGFGGGAKAVLPGVVGLKTIQANHRLCFNDGISGGMNMDVGSNLVEGNPVREDMNEVCKIVNPDFLFNVSLDIEGNFMKFVGGHFEKAWLEGCKSIRNLYGVPIQSEADIIIASAGGYPKDINLYQTIKTVENAIYGGKEGSTLVLLSECIEGLGADEFAGWFKYKTLEEMEVALKQNFTVPGFIAYKLAFTSVHRNVILISSLDDELVKGFNMIPCHDLNEAINMAYDLCRCDKPKITLMPYGGNTLPISM